MTSKDKFHDRRKHPIFIHSRLDELPLTMEAFRVYGHLARRASNDRNSAWPSYKTIGECCFKGSYPDAPSTTLRRKAIEAVKELIDWNLIEVEQGTPSEHQSNTYHLTDVDEWKDSVIPTHNNARKARHGKRSKKSDLVMGEHKAGDGGTPGVVMGEHHPSDSGSLPLVMGEHKASDGGTPKVFPLEVNQKEGNPLEVTPLTPQGERVCFEQTSPFQNSTVLTEEKEQPQTQTDDPKPLKESSANLSQKKITTARWRETGKLGKHGYPNVVNMQGNILELLPWMELNDSRSGYGFNPLFEAFVSKHLIKQKHYSQMQQGEFVAAIKDWIGRASESDFRFSQVMTRWEIFEAQIPESDKTVKELYQQHECEKRKAADDAAIQQRAQEWEQNPKPARKKLSVKDVM